MFELSYLSEFALTTSLRDDSYGMSTTISGMHGVCRHSPNSYTHTSLQKPYPQALAIPAYLSPNCSMFYTGVNHWKAGIKPGGSAY